MAQRLYLVPIPDDLVQICCDLVLDSANEEGTWRRLTDRAHPQRMAARHSVRASRALGKNAFARDGREGEYYQVTAQRPYLIVDQDSNEAARAARRIRHAVDESAVMAEFEGQLARLPSSLKTQPASDAGPEEPRWEVLRDDVATLRKWRDAFDRGVDSVMEAMARVDLPGLNAYDPDRTETKRLRREEIPAQYGYLLGALLGKIAWLCEPSWWEGRNFGIGFLRCDFIPLASLRRIGRLRNRIRSLCRKASDLLGRVGIPGFESGFDYIPTYSSGIWIPGPAVRGLLDLVQCARQDFLRLVRHSTGCSGPDARLLGGMIEEACLYAAPDNCGLLEFDDLLGTYGSRA